MIEIGKYVLDEPLQTKNSGFSKWGLGKYGGRKFFIKEYLSPVYPVDESLFAPEMLQSKRKTCSKYEKEKKRLCQQINEASDGNMLRTIDFFRNKSRYYVVSDWVEAIDVSEVLKLTKKQKLRLCAVLAHSIGKLHERNLVHADIKLDNIIFYRTKGNEISAKIIDLDNCFELSNPPKTEDEIAVDLVYMAPEAFAVLTGEAVCLTEKIDVFALGLLFHQILSGFMPEYDKDIFDYPYEVVMAGESFCYDPRLSGDVTDLLDAMLLCAPDNRMRLELVLDVLQKIMDENVKPIEAKQEGGYFNTAGAL